VHDDGMKKGYIRHGVVDALGWMCRLCRSNSVPVKPSRTRDSFAFKDRYLCSQHL
jgi:hypothetical protein